MFRPVVSVAVAAVCLALPIIAMPAAQADPFLPVPPASFLNYHVDTVGQLTEQVQLDETVRVRLARHFHMTGPQIASYIHDNLVLAHLPQTSRYKVACVTSSGREYWVSERLPMGTPVFALRGTNQPILRLVCGNPLVKTLPYVQKASVPKPAILMKTPTHSTVVPAAVPVAPKTVAFAPTGTLTAPRAGTLGPLVRVAGSTQKVGGHGIGFLPLLGVLPFLPGGGHHSSGPSPSTPAHPVTPGTPPTPTKPTTPPTPTKPTTPTTPGTPTKPTPPPSTAPVPEPSPALFFGLAGLGLAALRARRRKG